MGQKVHPKGLRLGIIKDWDMKWFSRRKYSEHVYEDYQIRKYIKDTLAHAGISVINIDRIANRIRITINCARPGIIIGRKGTEVNKLKDNLSKIVDGELQINIKEIKVPEVDAQLVAEDIANQILRRAAVKRTMKQAASRAIKMKAEGIKIMISGRIGGAEIARTEWHMEGRLPLHTLRADIDYGFSEANTTYGKIGIKVWIFKGEVLPGSISSERISDTSEETKKDKIEASLENDLPEKERLREEKNASTN
ncbi:MAG: 30S ribosomal protein S3 [Atribacterota bacterium]|nr:30S ribosomal protein S3 [Atribacterota bacterium]MDD5497072.1 30S ribosomal protein S3 [Atribacterota bacterium]